MSEYMIIVDEKDNELGIEEKIKVHQEGKLHRAFSILIYDSTGRMLLQQRSPNKLTCPNLWSNACCGHPGLGEPVSEAAARRLKEEMGLDCKLKESFSLSYYLNLENELKEHEFDYVFVGLSDEIPIPSKLEVQDYKLLYNEEINIDLLLNPQKYTPWFKLIFEKYIELGTVS